ncbi:MAG TPA: ISAzo13 family transposase, partial [Arthrobacter bacterium]|nr:ISAzo13 family transposase [Arthrobacter sp.]
WNKIEHRLFSQITRNWAGQPLRTHQIIVDLIGKTTTATGLTVQCVLDTDDYPTGLRYTSKDIEDLPITRHDFH